MSVIRNPTGSTDCCYDDVCYESFPVDKGYDYFVLFIAFLIVWWFFLNI